MPSLIPSPPVSNQPLELSTMRLLIAITNQDRRAAVYFNREIDEYIVRFYSHGEHLTSADYFTDCKSDAYNTMNHYAAGIDRHMAAFGGFPNSR
jgi:hypothetical protein